MIDKVKIDQVVYDVAETDEPILVNNRVCAGEIYYRMNTITLAKSAGLAQKDVTLMHEIVHGIIYERMLEKYINADDMDDFLDEMGKSILQLIRDNPELIEHVRR